MKKLLMALTALLAVLNWGCKDDGEIVFEHEKPMFELQSDAILLEVIVPLGTPADGYAIYMAGPVTGEDAESVIDNATWKLAPSNNSHKWGIYVKPSDFASGKTLADGYYFVSATDGVERDLRNGDVLHTETANVGERINNVTVVRWASYFLPPPEVQWPAVPDGNIQLRFTMPETTPDGYKLGLVGEFNGWDGAKTNWLLTQLSAKYYYINLDPTLFAADKSLADKFFVNVFTDDHDWWYHQNNDDGSGNEGPGLTVADAQTGKSYAIQIANWRNSADLPAGIPKPGAGQFLLKMTVPDYTPANSLIGLFGEWNGWGAMLGDKEKWTATYYPSGVYALMVTESDIAEGKTLADMFHITLYFPESTDGNWWKHQMNSDGSEAEGPGINNANNPASPTYTFKAGSIYTIDVTEWRNSQDIKNIGQDPDDVSVTPWKGLTVESGKILLQIEVPGYTPDDSTVALCGTVSGWEGGANNLDAFGAAYYNPGRYYVQLDPADFAAGTTLNDEFKFGLIQAGKDWWYHESSAGYRIAGTVADKAYTVTIADWNNKGDIPGLITYPDVSADKVMIHIYVPDTTPGDADIRICGDINSWNCDDAKWKAAKITTNRYYIELDPAGFASGSGLTKETTDNGFCFAIRVDGKDWYYFQSDDGNLLLPDGADVGNAYPSTVTAWKNAGEL